MNADERGLFDSQSEGRAPSRSRLTATRAPRGHARGCSENTGWRGRWLTHRSESRAWAPGSGLATRPTSINRGAGWLTDVFSSLRVYTLELEFCAGVFVRSESVRARKAEMTRLSAQQVKDGAEEGKNRSVTVTAPKRLCLFVMSCSVLKESERKGDGLFHHRLQKPSLEVTWNVRVRFRASQPKACATYLLFNQIPGRDVRLVK